jgi:putative phosphoesterase
MLLGIVSDTHGHAEFTLPAVRMLQSLEVDCVIHCGDIGSADIPGLFRPWPTHFVLGNVDANSAPLRAAIDDMSGRLHGRFGSLEIEECRIAFLHGDDERLLAETIAGGTYDLVCYGHTHMPEQHRVGRTVVVNPGALFRAQRHTIAIARLPRLQVHHVTV